MKLMIVESPNKVRKISSILGAGWKVDASVGHVRDLPTDKAGVGAPNYQPQYELTDRGRDVIARLRKHVADADEIYLATDPDREGEAIAWHLQQALKLDNPRRVTFDSITEPVIRAAIAKPRAIDIALVQAQEARRVLDRIVGFTMSPIVSHQLTTRASAGRVQSPAVRLVVEREREITSFRQTDHFGARLSFGGDDWTADWITKLYLAEGEKYILDSSLADRAANIRTLVVRKSEETEVSKSPPPPFTTSTLLQAASAQLRFKPDRTAKVSQALFEAGLITYHRTDSQNLSDEAISEIRAYAGAEGLALPDRPRKWGSKQDAQEAHEAIRPTHVETSAGGESDDEKALYDLIWRRAVASQLADVVHAKRFVGLEGRDSGGKFHYSATSLKLVKAGWTAVTARDAADEKDEDGPGNGSVPMLTVGSEVHAASGKVLAKKTSPPKRYTQASLIKKLEQLGIGRPSTFASIIMTIMKRGYVDDVKNSLNPSQLAERLVDALVGAYRFVEYDFTRAVEGELDAIASGKLSYHALVSSQDRLLQEELGRSGVDLSALTAPTAPQIKLANQLAEQIGQSVPEAALQDRGQLTAWLDQAKACADKARDERMRGEPASAAQISFITDLIAKGRAQEPQGWPQLDKKTASDIISACKVHLRRGGNGGGGKGDSRASARRRPD